MAESIPASVKMHLGLKKGLKGGLAAEEIEMALKL
jgi:hypothetical protein